MKKMYFLPGAMFLIILLFTYASMSKILAFKHFEQQLDNQPLPNSWTPFLAYSIPFIEMLIVVLLVFPPSRKMGFLVSAFFMLIFTLYSAIVLLHGFDYIPCSCGGVLEFLSWRQHLALNLFFLLLSLLGYISLARSGKTDG